MATHPFRAEIVRLASRPGPRIDLEKHADLLQDDATLAQIEAEARHDFWFVRERHRLHGIPAHPNVIALDDDALMEHVVVIRINLIAYVLRSEAERDLDNLIHNVEDGRLDAVREAAHGGVDVNASSRLDGGTPLASASATGESEVVAFLLGQGARVDLRGTQRGPLYGPWLPLMCATAHASGFAERHDKYLSTIRLLLQAGASPEEEDAGVHGASTTTPLAIAIRDAAQPQPKLPEGILALFKGARRRRLWQRWQRVAPLVGRWRKALMMVFDEVHYRPQHQGAKRAKAEFESLA